MPTNPLIVCGGVLLALTIFAGDLFRGGFRADPLRVDEAEEGRKSGEGSRISVPHFRQTMKKLHLVFGDDEILQSLDRIEIRFFPGTRTEAVNRISIETASLGNAT